MIIVVMIRTCFFFFMVISCISYAESPQQPDYSSIQEGFIQTDHARLFYRCLGQGDPLIVLHGGPGLSQDYLLPQLYELAKHNRVIFYDQRGCGQSTGEITPDTINIKTFVEDLDTLRQAFHFDTISLLGHSWGGFLAMHYALAHPQSVEKLFLSNSMPASSEGLDLFIQEWLGRTAPYQEELTALQPGFEQGDPQSTTCFYRILFRTYCYLPANADHLNLCMTPISVIRGAQVHKMVEHNIFDHPFDFHEALKSLTIPTLILHGDADPIPCKIAQQIHSSLPYSQLILIDQCGHFPYVEQPQIFFDAIEMFMTKNCAKTPN